MVLYYVYPFETVSRLRGFRGPGPCSSTSIGHIDCLLGVQKKCKKKQCTSCRDIAPLLENHIVAADTCPAHNPPFLPSAPHPPKCGIGGRDEITLLHQGRVCQFKALVPFVRLCLPCRQGL
eukprot:2001345-Amphidinium_carterae.1